MQAYRRLRPPTARDMLLSNNMCVSAIARHLAQGNGAGTVPASAATELQNVVDRLEAEVRLGSRAATEQHAVTLGALALQSQHGGRQVVAAALEAAAAADRPGEPDVGALQCLIEAVAAECPGTGPGAATPGPMAAHEEGSDSGTTSLPLPTTTAVAATAATVANTVAAMGSDGLTTALAATVAQLTSLVAQQQRQLEQQQATVATMFAAAGGMAVAGSLARSAGSLTAAASGTCGSAVLAAPADRKHSGGMDASGSGSGASSQLPATLRCNLPNNPKFIGSVTEVRWRARVGQDCA